MVGRSVSQSVSRSVSQ